MNLLDNYLGENLREIAPFDLQKYWRQLYQLVGTIFLLFIKNFPQNSKIGWELKTTRWFVFYTWPSMRFIHSQLNTGVSNKWNNLRLFRLSASTQENIAFIFTHVVCCHHYNFLLSPITMLLYISVYHEFIKRAIAFTVFR